MSALAPSPAAAHGWQRPNLLRLLGAVLGGEILGAVLLWLASVAVSLLRLAPIGGGNDWVWLPWQIDGVWALVGAIGWGYLVCMLIAGLVSERIERRGYGRPAAAWLRIAIAVSGYGAMGVGATPGAHVFYAVLAGAVLVRLLAFRLDGTPRPWQWQLSRRARAIVALTAALIGLSYGGLHAFAADGSGGTFADAPIAARIGHSETVTAGLSRMWLPADITGVQFSGPGAGHIRASELLISPDFVIGQGTTPLPYRVSAGQQVWISERVTLASCGEVTVNTLKLRYRVLGIGTTESIPLQQPLSLTCGR